MQQSGGAKRFCHAGKGVTEMWGVLGGGYPTPRVWGLPAAQLSVGIYLLFMVCGSSPGTRRGRRERGDDAGGGQTQKVPLGAHQHIPALLTAELGLLAKPLWWQVAAGGGKGWWPQAHVCVPSGWGACRGVPGGTSLQVRTQRCPQAFLPLPAQPLSLSAPSPLVWPTGAGRGTGEEKGVPGPPRARLETHFHFYCLLTSLCSSELHV